MACGRGCTAPGKSHPAGWRDASHPIKISPISAGLKAKLPIHTGLPLLRCGLSLLPFLLQSLKLACLHDRSMRVGFRIFTLFLLSSFRSLFWCRWSDQSGPKGDMAGLLPHVAVIGLVYWFHNSNSIVPLPAFQVFSLNAGQWVCTQSWTNWTERQQSAPRVLLPSHKFKTYWQPESLFFVQ